MVIEERYSHCNTGIEEKHPREVLERCYTKCVIGSGNLEVKKVQIIFQKYLPYLFSKLWPGVTYKNLSSVLSSPKHEES